MDFNTDVPSTVIDTDTGPSASGGGIPNLTEPVDTKPASLRDDLESVFKEDADKQKVEEQPKDEKPADDEKQEKPVKAPENTDEGKLAAEKPEPKKDAEEGGNSDPEPKEGEDKPEGKQDRRYPEAPSKFLPKAKEVWRNTPLAVQQEVDRIVREHETATQQHREALERYESVRDFDELARQNGRDLRQSLMQVNELENLLKSNPIAGLNKVLMQAGPRKADGQPVSLMEVAQFIVQKGPQGYQQMMAQAQQPQQQQAQDDPRIAQLQQTIVQMQEQQLAATIIDPFKRDHPRYAELEQDIAFFLQSGKIPTSLSPSDRLAAAYDMAERINPPSHAEHRAADIEGLEPDRRADTAFSGSKSIKSAPGSVSEDTEVTAKGDESVRDSILKEMRRLNRA